MNNIKDEDIKSSKIGQIKTHLGETIYLMRKAAKISQVELGTLLSLHQTAICRIEQGFQSLMIEQLYAISQFFEVKIDALIEGDLDYWKIAQKFNNLPPIPQRYCEFPFSKVREVLPSLKFLDKYKGEEEVSQMMSELNLPKAFFLNPDLALGVHCHLDILRYLIQNGELNRDTLSSLVDEARCDRVQGFLHPVYETQVNALGLIQTWVLNSHHYGSHFDYGVEELHKNSMVLSVTPQDHMKSVNYRDETLQDTLCLYQKTYLSHLAKYANSKPIEIQEKECHFHGAKQCVYELNFA